MDPEQQPAPIQPAPPPAFTYSPSPPPKRNVRFRSVMSTAALFIAAPLLAVLINVFVFQSYQVIGSSMEPTLHDNDRLIIWKFPKTLAAVTRKQFLPPRGTIIVFKKPGAEYDQLIKRVIGLPGDRVVVQNGSVTVYNDEHPNGFDPDDTEWGKTLSPTDGKVDTTVRPGEVFVLGDNRIPNASLDSRSSMGTIELHEIVGELSLRILPANKIEAF